MGGMGRHGRRHGGGMGGMMWWHRAVMWSASMLMAVVDRWRWLADRFERGICTRG